MAMTDEMWADFEAAFDGVQHSAFRLETLQDYASGNPIEQAALQRWLAGEPLPPRSPESDPWLERIARMTGAGAVWERVHLVELPLSDYLRFELAMYETNAAAGERIWLAPSDGRPGLAGLGPDFWLLDAGTAAARILSLDYSAEGALEGFQVVQDPAALAEAEVQRDAALRWAVPLAEWPASSQVA